MKKDWRDVLRGVKLADLEEHPERYRREPYRTAMQEMAEEGRRQMEEVNKAIRREMEETAGAVRQYRSVVAPVEPELRAAFALFEELQPEKAVAYIRAMESARMSVRGKRPRKRPSPYVSEHRTWILEAAKRLVMATDPDDKELARAIKKSGTKAAIPYLCKWIPHHRLEIESTATRISERAAAAVMSRAGPATRRGS